MDFGMFQQALGVVVSCGGSVVTVVSTLGTFACEIHGEPEDRYLLTPDGDHLWFDDILWMFFGHIVFVPMKDVRVVDNGR